MLTPEDRAMGPVLWMVSGVFAVIIAACLYWGRIPFGRYELVRRDEKSGLFWLGVATWGLMLVAAVWAALYFTLPEA